MYRDYFETDLEEDPEDDMIDELADKEQLAAEGQFRKYDFVETSLVNEPHENMDDLVE